jgi:hypothetical protein
VSTSSADPWSARRFFELLRTLGPLRVISQCGPSTFEAICELRAFGVAQGHMNAISDTYHWHVHLASLRYLRSYDQTYPRSGRRVLFFELREAPAAEPFLRIFLYRGKDEEFGDERERRFAAAHAQLSEGCELAAPEEHA